MLGAFVHRVRVRVRGGYGTRRATRGLQTGVPAYLRSPNVQMSPGFQTRLHPIRGWFETVRLTAKTR